MLNFLKKMFGIKTVLATFEKQPKINYVATIGGAHKGWLKSTDVRYAHLEYTKRIYFLWVFFYSKLDPKIYLDLDITLQNGKRYTLEHLSDSTDIGVAVEEAILKAKRILGSRLLKKVFKTT